MTIPGKRNTTLLILFMIGVVIIYTAYIINLLSKIEVPVDTKCEEYVPSDYYLDIDKPDNDWCN